MPKSQFNNDKIVEEMIGHFLDACFYKYFFPEEDYLQTRVTDLILQKQGIDVALTRLKDRKTVFIDEKCAAHYINSNLNTFAFEILGYEEKIGWLVDDSLVTDFYLLVWIRADEQEFNPVASGPTDYYKSIKYKDIFNVTCILVEKNRLVNHLKEAGLDKSELLNQAKLMREEKCKRIEKNGFIFTYSQKLKEGPVNILVPIDVLISLATNEHGCFYYNVDGPGYNSDINLPEVDK